jgi:hypothetical protein
MSVTKKEFLETLSSNEEDMGEGAAFQVTCEMHDIDQESAYELLASEDI